MRKLVLGISLLFLAGCATGEEWTTWKDHTSHFASGDHAKFSWRNGADKTRVTRNDVAMARDQNWWGKAITVDQQSIIER
jgi:hypothetical protein